MRCLHCVYFLCILLSAPKNIISNSICVSGYSTHSSRNNDHTEYSKKCICVLCINKKLHFLDVTILLIIRIKHCVVGKWYICIGLIVYSVYMCIECHIFVRFAQYTNIPHYIFSYLFL